MRRAAGGLAVVLMVATVLAQVFFPLVSAEPLAAKNPVLALLTVVTVVLFAGASLAHCVWSVGWLRAVVVLGVAGGGGLVAEWVGVSTGFPFGSYFYAGFLGPMVWGVPLVIGAAWFMMAWPTFLLGQVVARRCGWGLVGQVAVSAGTMTGWDLFLDPQMVRSGYWVWPVGQLALPGLPQIPLSNFAGWLLVSVLVHGVLGWSAGHAGVPVRSCTSGVLGKAAGVVPWVLLGWTWLGSTLAHVVWFGEPVAAVYGFMGMGVGCGLGLWVWRFKR